MKRHRESDFFIETSRFTIQGSSRAGRETWFLVPELRIALDIGRCPDPLVRISDIFISHAHLDHAAGIPFYGNQRRLLRLGTGTLHVPRETVEQYRELLRLHEALEQSEYPLEFVGMSSGDQVRLRPDLLVRAHRSTHRVPTNAYELLRGAPGEPRSILYYTGDTDRRTLDERAEIYRAEVLIVECSFTAPGDEERAARFRHIHVSDIFERADEFENEIIVLSHFSLRSSPGEIQRTVARTVPARLRDRIRLALPEPFSKL